MRTSENMKQVPSGWKSSKDLWQFVRPIGQFRGNYSENSAGWGLSSYHIPWPRWPCAISAIYGSVACKSFLTELFKGPLRQNSCICMTTVTSSYNVHGIWTLTLTVIVWGANSLLPDQGAMCGHQPTNFANYPSHQPRPQTSFSVSQSFASCLEPLSAWPEKRTGQKKLLQKRQWPKIHRFSEVYWANISLCVSWLNWLTSSRLLPREFDTKVGQLL